MSETNGNSKTRRYSLRRKQEPLLLENPETEELEHYVLQEMSGTERDAYAGFMGGRVRGSGDNAKIDNYNGLYSSLISRCLHRAQLELDNDGEVSKILSIDKVCVSEKEVQAYPASVQQDLFELCQDLNGLRKGIKEEAKNS